MFIERTATAYLQYAKIKYPVLTVTGPRQSGKTTLCRHLFPTHTYINLEAPDVLMAAKEDPRGLLKNGLEPMIIDEAQKCPELLSYIQLYVDERKQMGQFILTGSAQFQLLSAITQSLAGRSAMLSLLPLSLQELSSLSLNFHENPNSILFKGLYPALFERELDSTDFFRNYVLTFVERDLRQIINVTSLLDFQKFLKLLAGRVGQLVNFASLATEVGVSQPTIKQWISVLETAYIIKTLHPYFENFGKRAIKSPKLYFLDTGLLCYLLGIENETQLERDPLRGSIFENFVIVELIKARWNLGKEHQLYFFRDNHGNEIDALFQSGPKLCPIEIKSSQTFTPSLAKGLEFFSALVGNERIENKYIVLGRESEASSHFKDIHLVAFWKAAEIVSPLKPAAQQ